MLLWQYCRDVTLRIVCTVVALAIQTSMRLRFSSQGGGLLAALLCIGLLIPCHGQIAGGLLSESTNVACSNIYTNNGDQDPSSTDPPSTLSCNKASVLTLSVPLVLTAPGAYQFKFTESGPTGGGSLKIDPNQCAQGPGYCLFGRDFYVEITVSDLATAYDLVSEDIVAPFGYMYENCITKAPSAANSFYPYYMEGTCGVADIWDDTDYIECGDTAAFPPGKATQYSDCAFMCGWEKTKKITQDYDNNSTAFQEDYCGKLTVHDVEEDYFDDTPTPLGCAKATSYNAATDPGLVNFLPNFPRPTGICSCPGNGFTDVYKGPSGQTQRTVSSVVPCKSCAGSGACGTALPLPQETSPDQCLDTDQDRNTVCECTGNLTTDGLKPQDDPNTVCFNTQQSHRCLKCQPTLYSGSTDKPCTYMDVNKFAFCRAYWGDICGAGNYGLSGQITDKSNSVSGINLCNCMGVFVERSYWVKPVTAPYRIQNPSVPQYVIQVTLLYGEAFGDLNGTAVPNGTMTVGAGFSPFFAAPDKCSSDNETISATLSWINGTIDGFAVTEIIGTYTSNGGSTTNLQGSIVMANNADGYCGNQPGVSTTDVSAVPSTGITVTDPTGLINPWNRYRNCNTTAACSLPLVPLPDYIFDNDTDSTGCNLVTANNGAWWYYLSQEDKDTFGGSCGQNGMTLNGVADTATSRTMCAGPQGTCIPGIDTRLQGEAVKPPCSVAVDFLEYVKKYRTDTSGATSVKPPHVPNDWNPALPNYAVHRGKLFAYADPQVTGGKLAAELRLSIAADFDGVIVAQSSGTVTAVSCFISTATGEGTFLADATNLGSVPASYQFISGDGTTPAVYMDAQIRTLPAAATTRVSLVVKTVGELWVGDSINDQFMTVSLSTQLGPFFLGLSDPVQCIPQYGNPIISPILPANTTLTESLADTVFNALANNPQCGLWCTVISPWSRGKFFTPLEWTIIILGFTITLTVAIAYVILVVGQNIAVKETKNTAEEKQFEREEERAERVASKNALKILHSKDE